MDGTVISIPFASGAHMNPDSHGSFVIFINGNKYTFCVKDAYEFEFTRLFGGLCKR